MVKSMTGYGRAEATLNNRTYVVEVRSVNNRHLDCTIKMPRAYTFAEDAMKKCVQAAVSRGKVDVFVTIDSSGAETEVIKVNEPVAAGYCRALRELGEKFGLTDDLSISVLAKFPDVLLVEKAEEDQEAITEELTGVLKQALESHSAMREREGQKLAEDVLGRVDTMEGYLTRVEERSPQTLAEYQSRLEKKIAEVLQDKQIDEARILTEAAIFADKIAVDEETVRLRSHFSQCRNMIAVGGSVGRKLDFLIQEMNRETNTIGSKCSDLEISKLVVEMKAEIEKIREQIQNLE